MAEATYQLGAPAALKGYRVQALYTLRRILGQGENDIQFQLEGEEDLDVLDTLGRLLELVQVKKYDSLKLSDLSPHSPESPGSFFGRAVRFLGGEHQPTIKLVNFGAIGPEMRQAWAGDEAAKERIVRRLSEGGFSKWQVDAIFTNIELISLDEAQEEGEVYRLLQEMNTGVDPNSAFELLQHWLFYCMEHRRRITRTDVIAKVNRVGQFSAERRDHQDQWFTTIQPLQDRLITTDEYKSLQREFYEGGFTKFEHILAGLDFYREQKFLAIKAGFQRSNIVIVHAASGQGKTALCYRYLKNQFPSNWRFAIQRIENIQHALHIVNALNGHANAIQAPMAIFVDVNPRDGAWPELIRQLARHQYLHVLVAIREEDFRRANTSWSEFDFVDVDLEFCEGEARLIFERAKAYRTQTEFLNFESAWDAFGGSGPLLEFIFQLTQTTTLRQRLEAQVNRIRDEVREKSLSPDELKFLCLTAIATAYEARLNTRKLTSYLSLPTPERTLQFYEREYLIRISDEGQYIEGLHAIRSGILADLLISGDVNPWLEAAIEVLPLIEERDLESFILHSLIDRPFQEHSPFINAVTKVTLLSWAGLAGVLRSLLWTDTREYIQANQPTIEEAREEFGPGWYLLLDLNFAGDEGPNIDRWWADEKLNNIFPRARIEKLDAIRSTQTPKETAFQISKTWLNTVDIIPIDPITISDWAGAAEVLYWAKRFDIQRIARWISDETLDNAVQVVPLSNLAELSFALHSLDEKRCHSWLTRNHITIRSRLAKEYGVIYLQENGDLLTLHFLTPPDVPDAETTDPLHAGSIERVQLARQMFPGYEKYGSQGYGHKPGPFELKYDSTEKSGIKKTYLVPDLVVRINGIATGIGRNQFRPESWHQYIANVLEVRRLILTCLEQLNPGLGKYLERRNPVNVGAVYINKSDWQRCAALLSAPPDLPKTAVDRWGFATESSSKLTFSADQQRYVPSAIALRRYKSYLEAQRRYFLSIHNFILQAEDVTVTNFNLSKLPPTADREGIIQALSRRGVRTDLGHLSTYNLWEAKAALGNYQQDFRQLFGHLIEAETLDNLFRQETDLLSRVWPLWYFYAHEPQDIIRRALHRVPRKVESENSRIDRLIQQAIKEINTVDMVVELLPPGLKWEDSSALWIKLDVQDPIILNQAFESLLISLQTALSPIKSKDLAYYLIQESYQYIVIIPTVSGQMVSENVWPLFSASTILRQTPLSEQNWILYIPKPISSEIRASLGLKAWDLPEIEQANQLSAVVSSLLFVASQISELDGLPDVSEAGLEMLQEYVSDRSKLLSDMLQNFLDSSAALLADFSSLSETERKTHPYLQEAILVLADISETILPDNGSSELRMNLTEVVKYAQRIAGMLQQVEFVRLCRIADAIYEYGK